MRGGSVSLQDFPPLGTAFPYLHTPISCGRWSGFNSSFENESNQVKISITQKSFFQLREEQEHIQSKAETDFFVVMVRSKPLRSFKPAGKKVLFSNSFFFVRFSFLS